MGSLPQQIRPEEKVRQSLLTRLIDELGFPRHLLAVEKELREIPGLILPGRQIPRRRFDVLAFASGEVGLVPLLLIECKAEEIDENARQQVIGYNDSVRARFIALVGKESEEMGYFDETKRRYLFEPKLPTYRELLSR